MIFPVLTLPQAKETHVWQLYLPAFQPFLSPWWEWLSTDEQERAQRFYKAEDRDRFILSRGGLRYLLSRYLACHPETLDFTYSHYGKPSLVTATAQLAFNLAHSGAWVVYAISRQKLVGIDVEQVQPRAYLEGLVERCLTPVERQTLPLNPQKRLYHFFQYWTVKEAHLKAIGLGLSYPMTAIQVEWQPSPHLSLAAQTTDCAGKRWTLQLWEPAAVAIAAVCTEQTANQITINDFPIPI
ncbi:MAG: 4'-phosphopantetheinyl transferase superfamily protein [Cyanobacteria bacterium J06638_28]